MPWVSPGATLWLISTAALNICCLSCPTRLHFPDPPQHLLLSAIQLEAGVFRRSESSSQQHVPAIEALNFHCMLLCPCQGRPWTDSVGGGWWAGTCHNYPGAIPSPAHVINFFQHVWTHLITQTIFQALLGFSMEIWMGCDGSGQSPRHLVSQHQGVQHSMTSLRARCLLLCLIHHVKDKFIWGSSRACFRPAKAAGWALWTHYCVLLKQMHILPLLSLL